MSELLKHQQSLTASERESLLCARESHWTEGQRESYFGHQTRECVKHQQSLTASERESPLSARDSHWTEGQIESYFRHQTSE